ncbi:MAG TPA: putative sulfate exporter family transporter [Candidatus Omnitrophota bacterium]|nr:putative sulfate exporter family transporter [Candidatus Omnitrophota bacterium]HQL40928.1 putative sulfate exporter family transporter [Candidatus Omnitrophota bacterium]
MNVLSLYMERIKGLGLSLGIGFLALFIYHTSKSHWLDPLLIALVLGLAVRPLFYKQTQLLAHTKELPSLLIPIGVLLYGSINLDFHQVAAVKIDFLFLTFFVFMVFILVTLALSIFLGLKEQVAYLLTSGSTICGASAITVTSQAVDAEADDVSISLLAVFFAGLIALFLLLPFLRSSLGLSQEKYAVFAGASLQFTGFVKVAVGDLADQARALAMSVKAVRYLGLLFLVPFFASMIKGKIFVPWFLWGFLVSGILFSLFQDFAVVARPSLKPLLDMLWSSAMAAIGFNTNIRSLFSMQYLKAFCVSLVAFTVAACVFLLGLSLGMGS